MNFAWPGAEIAVIGSKRSFMKLSSKKKLEAADPAAKLLEKEAEYADLFCKSLHCSATWIY